MPIHRKLVFLLILSLCAFAFAAEPLSVRLEVVLTSAANSDNQMEASISKSVELGLYDVLEWRFNITDDADTVFQAIIENLQSSTILFPNQRYLSFGLRMKLNGKEAVQQFAVLGKTWKELETKVSQAVRDQLRYNLLDFTSPPTVGWPLQYIHAAGLSLLADPTGFRLGERYTLTDYHGRDLGLVFVADIIPLEAGKSEHAIEFNLIQADRRPEPGMLVIKKTSQWSYAFGPVVSSTDFGLEIEATVPLPSANSFFSMKSGIWMPYTIFSTPEEMELSLRVGLGARLGFASLTGQTDQWFSDMEVGLAVRFGFGLQFKVSGPPLFIYGAEAELALRYYTSSQWSWGLAVGSRFWNAMGSGSLTTLHGTDRIFVTPFIGFAW